MSMPKKITITGLQNEKEKIVYVYSVETNKVHIKNMSNPFFFKNFGFKTKMFK